MSDLDILFPVPTGCRNADDMGYPPANALALLRGNARESSDSVDEARAESSCSLGVGCGTSGVCYAEHHGMPEQCGRKTHNAGVTGLAPAQEKTK